MLKNKDLISINDTTKEELRYILDTIKKIEEMDCSNLCKGKILGTLFFEPSTRTRLSFESAMKRLGGSVIGFSGDGSTSRKKGESLYDTIKTVEGYCDIIAMRHPVDGSARLAANSVIIPIINGGDGANQHPTQTLLDLHTIRKSHGQVEGLTIAMVGDLKYGRTVHSLAIAMSLFNATIYFVAPQQLQMPKDILEVLDQRGIKYYMTESIMDVMDKTDILYMTRIQKERFPDPVEYEKMKNAYILKKEMLTNAKSGLKVMHPLPRVNEISEDVDDAEHAHYFQQAHYGIPTRMAIIALLLGVLE
ncbi:aspartate carbamoyltransferase [Candidatus Woesearchaeota archaeon]|nr:aspartate carbamoyltransferase [Candidatus Woesearchaeota archaeon]